MMPAFLSRRKISRGVQLTTHLYIVFPFHAMKAWKGKTLPVAFFTDKRNEELSSQRLDYKLLSTVVITL